MSIRAFLASANKFQHHNQGKGWGKADAEDDGRWRQEGRTVLGDPCLNYAEKTMG